MRWLAAVAASTVILLAGCGHHAGGPKPSTMADVSARYLRAATKANVQVAAGRAIWTTAGADLGRVRAGLLAIAKAREQLDLALRGIRPPAEQIAADLSRLLSTDLVLEARLHAAASAETTDQLQSLEPQMFAAGRDALDAANALRRDLGLPPAP